MIDFEKRLKMIAEDEELIFYSNECIKGMVEEELLEILNKVGIPRFWTPDVDFIREEKGGFKKMNYFINQSTDDEIIDKYIKYREYIVFAMYNNDFITLKEENKVVLVQMEQSREIYVAQNIKVFIYSLIMFNEIVIRIINEFPDCDYYVDYLNEEDMETFKAELSNIDEKAMEEESFWNMVIHELLEEKL